MFLFFFNKKKINLYLLFCCYFEILSYLPFKFSYKYIKKVFLKILYINLELYNLTNSNSIKV